MMTSNSLQSTPDDWARFLGLTEDPEKHANKKRRSSSYARGVKDGLALRKFLDFYKRTHPKNYATLIYDIRVAFDDFHKVSKQRSQQEHEPTPAFLWGTYLRRTMTRIHKQNPHNFESTLYTRGIGDSLRGAHIPHRKHKTKKANRKQKPIGAKRQRGELGYSSNLKERNDRVLRLRAMENADEDKTIMTLAQDVEAVPFDISTDNERTLYKRAESFVNTARSQGIGAAIDESALETPTTEWNNLQRFLIQSMNNVEEKTLVITDGFLKFVPILVASSRNISELIVNITDNVGSGYTAAVRGAITLLKDLRSLVLKFERGSNTKLLTEIVQGVVYEQNVRTFHIHVDKDATADVSDFRTFFEDISDKRTKAERFFESEGDTPVAQNLSLLIDSDHALFDDAFFEEFSVPAKDDTTFNLIEFQHSLTVFSKNCRTMQWLGNILSYGSPLKNLTVSLPESMKKEDLRRALHLIETRRPTNNDEGEGNFVRSVNIIDVNGVLFQRFNTPFSFERNFTMKYKLHEAYHPNDDSGDEYFDENELIDDDEPSSSVASSSSSPSTTLACANNLDYLILLLNENTLQSLVINTGHLDASTAKVNERAVMSRRALRLFTVVEQSGRQPFNYMENKINTRWSLQDERNENTTNETYQSSSSSSSSSSSRF